VRRAIDGEKDLHGARILRGTACYAARMFKHLLLPTDGSALAVKGVKTGVPLCRRWSPRAR